MSPLHESTLELASRLNATAQVCEVTSARSLSTSLREVVLTGATLAGEPGNDVMILVGEQEGHILRRRYSVREVRLETNELTLWIATAHEGPGAAWARTVTAGSPVDVVGPRGKIVLDPLADWHLFMGDVSALSAAYRMAGAIEPPGQAVFIIEIGVPDDAVTATFDEGVGVTGIFVDRRGRSLDDASGLLTGLAAFEMPAGEGHAYLFGEFSIIRALSAALTDRGLEAERISSKAYWRQGRPNAAHGEPDKR